VKPWSGESTTSTNFKPSTKPEEPGFIDMNFRVKETDARPLGGRASARRAT
jgi:hypothetical protein